MVLPRHIAIIMDGNGRWAQARQRPRVYGHVKGAMVAREIITECVSLGIQNLTLYTFSTENWKRPISEVSFLMTLLERYLKKERRKLMEQNIRFRCLGDIEKLPAAAKSEVLKTIEMTKDNTGMNLVFALNYGGRQEILNATKTLAEKVARGEIRPSDINEALFSQSLESSFLPDPDLLIRTSGEFRLSNFLLWQSSYSELYVTETLWPDFQKDDLLKAIHAFSQRERRYGQISSTPGQSTTPQESNVITTI